MEKMVYKLAYSYVRFYVFYQALNKDSIFFARFLSKDKLMRDPVLFVVPIIISNGLDSELE
jgi:hypothetical protein